MSVSGQRALEPREEVTVGLPLGFRHRTEMRLTDDVIDMRRCPRALANTATVCLCSGRRWRRVPGCGGGPLLQRPDRAGPGR